MSHLLTPAMQTDKESNNVVLTVTQLEFNDEIVSELIDKKSVKN